MLIGHLVVSRESLVTAGKKIDEERSSKLNSRNGCYHSVKISYLVFCPKM
jgi:hypothetical protein